MEPEAEGLGSSIANATETGDSQAFAPADNCSDVGVSENTTNTHENGDNADIENKDKNANNEPNGGNASPEKPTKTTAAAASPCASRGTSKSYAQLVHEAIVALKDRTGSSQPAIMKYLASKYPNLQTTTPNNRFKQHILTALKSGVKSGRFQKVRASFKINAEWKKQEVAAQKRKKAQEIKKKKDIQKKKEEAKKEEAAKKDAVQTKIDMLREKDRDQEILKKLLAEQKRKAEAEARKRYIAERLKKRRYPMEDTMLHAEDKELGVKPPKDVGPRPILPFFFSMTQNEERRSNNKYAAAASKCEGSEKGNRGLVSDLLQVYHFFRGDVHYVGTGLATSDREIVPEFTLKHLIHAVDDILSGTSKRARMVPPLIVHLFVTCLQLLTLHPDEEGGASSEDSQQRRQLQQDFATHLNGALSPTSWADVLQLYFDAMHRHYTSDASVSKNVLMGLPIDSEYLLGVRDEEGDMPATELPAGYSGYLGDPDSTLARAHQRLERYDPWLLTAEELMALLRALTDDVLARKPEIGEDISNREEKMHELLKAKKVADAKFRKIRLAFEGPKKPPKKPTTNSNTIENKTEKGDTQNSGASSPELEKSKSAEEKEKNFNILKEEKADEWVPTATKKQFEAAKKAQQKASDAYEKGVRKLMARTEPVGWDRNHNGVYCFRHDPDVLYVEVVKSASSSDTLPEELRPRKSSWHIIETKSLFDQYAESLDVRGKRENSLYEELMGPQGAQQSLRRFLFDDIKEKAIAASQLKEKEDLKRRLENAKLKCDEEEGRRSGRLASRAEEELEQIEVEINNLERKIHNGAVVKEVDYAELTGLELLRKFDSAGKMETRKTREKKAAATVNNFDSMQCSKLCSTGNIDGTGFLGMLASKLLDLEETCESLVPWGTRKDREVWISELENLVFAWNAASPLIIGPADVSPQLGSPRPSMDMTSTPISASEASKGSKKRQSTGGALDSKRSKTDDSPSSQSSLTVSQAIAKLRQPLLDLEKRVFEITGLAMAAQDVADADDNMSADGEEESNDNESKEKRAWKKLLNKLRSIPSKRHTTIREIVVDAIAAARKAQLKVVVGQLRSALLEFHPNAAGACKSAAIKVLDSHGGYEEDEEDDGEEEEETNEEAEDGKAEGRECPSALSADAVIVNSSLDGIEDAGHIDWVDAVKSAKTLSRMATLVTSFVTRATAKLSKAREERQALIAAVSIWEKEEERRMKNGTKNSRANKKADSVAVSEVWANVDFTDEMSMVVVEPYPWWPAKRCLAKDANLEASLKAVHRCLVSLVGESGAIRVVEMKHVRPFTGKLVEEEDGIDMSDLTKETKTQLDDCMAMARRMLRAKGKKKNGSRP